MVNAISARQSTFRISAASRRAFTALLPILSASDLSKSFTSYHRLLLRGVKTL